MNVENENQPSPWETNRLLPINTTTQKLTYSTGAWPSLIFILVFVLCEIAVLAQLGLILDCGQVTSLCYCPSSRPWMSVFTLVEKKKVFLTQTSSCSLGTPAPLGPFWHQGRCIWACSSCPLCACRDFWCRSSQNLGRGAQSPTHGWRKRRVRWRG